MTLSWLTAASSANTTCVYGTSPTTMTSTATGAPGKSYATLGYKSPFIHNVRLSGLALSTTYSYKCGDDTTGWTNTATFTSSPGVGPKIPYTFGVVGDLGQTNYSLATMQHMLAAPHIDSVFITGDISYADSDQPRWDSFQRLAQPLASSKPWMVASGNHELEVSLFTAYQARFASMPSGGRSDGALYYSYEVGPAHVLVVASFWLYEEGSAQYTFIKSDLASVDRAKTPWLIVILHAPWYNSNKDHTNDGQLMRQTLEPMFYDAGVDIVFAGHVHAYERCLPSFSLSPNVNGSVHVTIGDGGNREGLYGNWIKPQPAWSVFRAAEYGHGELQLLPTTPPTAKWTWIRNVDVEPTASDTATWVNVHV